MAPLFPPVAGGFGVECGGWRGLQPLRAEIVDGAEARWLSAPYAHKRGSLLEGTLVTPKGTRLRFSDRYRARRDGFDVARTVRVLAVGPGETAFSSRFALMAEPNVRLRDREAFVPAILYGHPEDLPKGALGGDSDAGTVLIREDRLPLPLAMLRDPATGGTVELLHRRPDGATFAGEDFAPRIVNGRMRFGSIGFLNEGGLEIAFQFPGSEGGRTYISPREAGWSLRSHPLQVGFEQRYELRFTRSVAKTYAEAVGASWRRAFEDANPKPPKVSHEKVYRASMDLLAHYGKTYDGVPSMPFQARLPDGVVIDTSSQMGFVGKALPAAALLLKDALDHQDAERRKQAEALVDFWVARSMNLSGVPKTWYDIPKGGGEVTWRGYPTHLRVAGDGVRGVLAAHRLAPNPAWLAYARQYGDFLVEKQAEDGSLAGLWKWDGTPERTFKNVTDHAIPVLADLYRATGDERYCRAAIRAGEYCLPTVHAAFRYVGGAADNPNVPDKEAGVLAMQAFLALYDLTGEAKWIAPAAQAATFCETWTYAWNVPVPKDDPKAFYPKNRTTLGVSIIATGHSGADDFMAITVYDYYRLYLLTRDAHFLRFARFLDRATKQLVNWDGSLGYAYPGLLMEALNLSPRRGNGVRGWLPWLTVGILEPLVRMREAFGTDDLDRIERLPFKERLRRVAPRP